MSDWQTALTVGDLIGLRKDDSGEWSDIIDSVIARRMRTLAANLATAGALCAAHTGIDDTDGGGKWWPGCGRAAPGWER